MDSYLNTEENFTVYPPFEGQATESGESIPWDTMGIPDFPLNFDSADLTPRPIPQHESSAAPTATIATESTYASFDADFRATATSVDKNMELYYDTLGKRCSLPDYEIKM